MGKTGGGRGTNQYQVKGRSIAQDGTLGGEATQQAAAFDLDPTWGAPENIGAERGNPCDRCGERTGDVQPYGPTGANHWCSTCANERSLEDLKADPEGAARNFILNATGSYPSDSGAKCPHGNTVPGCWCSPNETCDPCIDDGCTDADKPSDGWGNGVEPSWSEEADDDDEVDEYETYLAQKQARDEEKVSRFVSGELSRGDLHHMFQRGEISPRLYRTIDAALDERDGRVRYPTVKIDKREARKRWERGLGVAMSAERDWYDDPDSFSYAGNFVTKDEYGDFDDLCNNSARGGVKAFAKPVVTGGIYDTYREVSPSQIEAGDRIDVGAVGNWKVRRVEDRNDHMVMLRMGDDDGPILRIATKSADGTLTDDVVDARLLDSKTLEPYANVTDSFKDRRITRREPQTDPVVIRERIAVDFPNATFGPEGTHTMYDGQIVKIPDEVHDDGHPITRRHLAKRAAIIEQAVVRWTPNTAADDLVRPARRR